MENNAEIVKEHGRNLANIFGRLSDVENEMAEVMAWKDRVDMDLYNHGGPTGMKTMLTALITRLDERDVERKRAAEETRDEMAAADRRKDRKINLMLLIIAILTLFLGWRTYLDTVGHVKSGDLKIPVISHAEPTDPAYAVDKPQDAAIPIQP